MPRFVVFLRAINAGPGRVVRMRVLRKAFESLGFAGVATFLGSGNIVFETRTKDVFIRTHSELKRIASLEPFKDSETCGADLNIILLANNLDERFKAKLIALGTGTDGFRVRGREIYWWRRKKPGTSLFTTVPLAKVLRVPFTIRGANTIRKLIAKCP